MQAFPNEKILYAILWWIISVGLVCIFTFALGMLLFFLSKLESTAGRANGSVKKVVLVRLVSLLSLLVFLVAFALIAMGSFALGARLLLAFSNWNWTLIGEVGAAAALPIGVFLFRILFRDFTLIEFNYSKCLFRFVETLVVGFRMNGYATWIFNILSMQSDDSRESIRPIFVVFFHLVLFTLPLAWGWNTVNHLKSQPPFAHPGAQFTLVIGALVVLILYTVGYLSVGSLLGPEQHPLQAMRKKRNKMLYWLLVMALGIGVSLAAFLLSFAENLPHPAQATLVLLGIVLSVISTLDPLCNAYGELRAAIDASEQDANEEGGMA